MLVYMLDVKNQRTLVKDIKDELQTFYDFIGCRCIDIPHRKIGGEPFAIICDDEGLFEESPIPATFIDDGHTPTMDIVGNIIIAKDGPEGELAGLTPYDLMLIKQNIYVAMNDKGDTAHVIKVDY